MLMALKSKKSSLNEFLFHHKIDIACITEKFKINSYNSYRKDRDTIHSSGGLAILVKRTIKTSPTNHP
jgi:hypothetical protein